MKRKSLSFILIIVFLGIGVLGCQNTRFKGTEEEGQQKEEPEVVVVNNETGDQQRMKLEKYIAAVVAGEMKPNWPENAYAAQAIIARTFAMEYMERRNTNQISANFEEAQAYKPDQVTEVIGNAVEKTRGKVVLHNGKFIQAWFHSSAGGKTTSAKSGLAYAEAEPPYIHSVESPDEMAPDDIKNWRSVFDNGALADALAQIAGVQANQITDIQITEKDQTGRATKLQIEYDGGTKTVEAPKFRNALDPMVLKSTMIKKISKTGDGFAFEGSGFGHGVGMSQWGAYKMARDGKSPEQIINHYFRDVEIEKIYE